MISFSREYSPLVSVVLPAYGRQRFLAESIRSILKQTYDNIELIVIDDGSKESLEELVLAVAPRARYVRQSHAGVAAARNRGLKVAKGQLIAFQDSDDVWHPQKLSKQVALLNSRSEVGVVCTAKRSIDEVGKVVGGQWKQLHSGYVTEPLFREVFVTMPSVLMRRDVAEYIGEFDTSLKINSDYQYWLRASLATKFMAIDLPLVDVRRSAERLTLARTKATVLRYRMLSDFYDTPEGHRSIRPALAKRVLAKAAFRAALALSKDGRREAAEEYLSKSLAFRLTPRAAWAWLQYKCSGGKQSPEYPRIFRPLDLGNCIFDASLLPNSGSSEKLASMRRAA